MNEQEVVDLMSSSKNKQEWNRNCDTVKERCGGYPKFWYKAVVLSGLMNRTLGEDSDKIHITYSPETYSQTRKQTHDGSPN
jgi:hypothetical protein